MNCEQLLLTLAGGDAYSDEFLTVTSFYGCEFDPREHPNTFTHNILRVENVTLSNVLALYVVAVFTPATTIVTDYQISNVNPGHVS